VLRRDDAADSLLEESCKVLSNMTFDVDNQKAAGRGGGLEAVISVLRKNDVADLSDSLLEHACWAMLNMIAVLSDLEKSVIDACK
jgi:hypothetical protein